jgi:glucosamine--fructose-6-phosphate aminotransferase (isomerizing)
MCGIVGVAGDSRAVEIVLNGLERLEYRGYDSAGVAVLNPSGKLEIRKAVGKLAALRDAVAAEPLSASTLAIGHTRWATHGAPTTANAHPHVGKLGNISLAVVHNGIIENYQELRAELTPQGAQFITETDTETIPFTLASALNHGSPNLQQAVKAARQKFRGSYAFVAMQEGQGDTLVATRRGAPLCIGVGTDPEHPANYFASDPLALAGITSRFMFLEDDDIAVITPQKITITNKNGEMVERETKVIDLSGDLAGKQGYKHFMLKEIFEQPAVVSRILQSYTTTTPLAAALPIGADDLRNATAINIVACGTAYYAALAGKYVLEQFLQVPVNVDVASEFRYRNPPFVRGGMFVAVSQSGETADTLAALMHAKAAGQRIVVLTNVPTSSMARMGDVVVDLLAGREVAVASTKAFTAMVLCLTLLGLQGGAARGHVTAEDMAQHIADLRTLPNHLTSLLSSTKALENLAEELVNVHSMLYLGRGLLAPLALEGSLKMKEISYVHAEGYASGEMKHGPIALVDNTLPVVNLAASNDGLFEKTVSNLKEVEARRGRVILITDKAGADMLDPKTRAELTLLEVPTVPTLLLPMVYTVPQQLLAYYTATSKGTDVDQPRNLAKSVTVE